MLLSSIVAMPFIAAVVLLFVSDRDRLAVRIIALLGAGYSLLASCLVALRYDIAAGGFQMAETHALVPAFGIAFRFAVDGWGVSLLLLTGLVIVAGVLASWTLDDRSKNFFITLLVLVTGVFGVFVSQDLFVFFLFYEIAVLPMYLLIGIWGSSHAVTEAGPFKFVWRLFDIGGREYAAMKLTLMLLVGSAFIIAVMLAMYLATGAGSFDMQLLGSFDYDRTLQMWCFPLLWLGFGSLAGVFPFHTWSPDGHASAPTAVSMLHAGVLMKLGAFGIMRVGFIMLPEGAVAWAPLVGCVAVVNIVYGALSAMSQRDLKYVVAYSSVSHMGVVMLGAATLTVEGWNGAVYQMFAHGLMTASSLHSSASSTAAPTPATCRPWEASGYACPGSRHSSRSPAFPRSACPAPRDSWPRSWSSSVPGRVSTPGGRSRASSAHSSPPSTCCAQPARSSGERGRLKNSAT